MKSEYSMRDSRVPPQLHAIMLAVRRSGRHSAINHRSPLTEVLRRFRFTPTRPFFNFSDSNERSLPMAYDRVIGFWQRVQNDTDLQQKIKSLESKPREQRPGAMAKLEQEKGFSFTPAELLEIEAVLAFWQKVSKD